MVEQTVKDVSSIYCLAIVRTPVRTWECKEGILTLRDTFRSLHSRLGEEGRGRRGGACRKYFVSYFRWLLLGMSCKLAVVSLLHIM
jgi:hypothetical protein